MNEAAADYASRIAHFCPLEQRELKDAAQVRRKFERAKLVALDPAGRLMDSTAFARWLERLRDAGPRQVVFLVGGADGLPDQIRREAELLSLSRLTMPHELARVVLLEQLYRAFATIRNYPYPR